MMMAAAVTINKMAPDALDGGRQLYLIMARMRRLDLGYMAAVGAFHPRQVQLV